MARQDLQIIRGNREKAGSPDDRDLIRRSLQGESQAFELIVEKYRNRVYWIAYNLVLDSEDARDIAQQSFLKVWQSLADFDPERPFSAWLSRITANCAVDFLRSRKNTEPLEEVVWERPAIERDMDVRKVFERIVPLLAERQRVVLVLREIHEMDFAEIAGMLDCTESTVRNLLSQAKESFRKKVKELFPDYGPLQRG